MPRKRAKPAITRERVLKTARYYGSAWAGDSYETQQEKDFLDDQIEEKWLDNYGHEPSAKKWRSAFEAQLRKSVSAGSKKKRPSKKSVGSSPLLWKPTTLADRSNFPVLALGFAGICLLIGIAIGKKQATTS